MSPLLTRRPKPVTPLDGVDLLLADLDGVVYAGPNAIPHAVESLNLAQQSTFASDTSPTTLPGPTPPSRST